MLRGFRHPGQRTFASWSCVVWVPRVSSSSSLGLSGESRVQNALLRLETSIKGATDSQRGQRGAYLAWRLREMFLWAESYSLVFVEKVRGEFGGAWRRWGKMSGVED